MSIKCAVCVTKSLISKRESNISIPESMKSFISVYFRFCVFNDVKTHFQYLSEVGPRLTVS